MCMLLVFVGACTALLHCRVCVWLFDTSVMGVCQMSGIVTSVSDLYQLQLYLVKQEARIFFSLRPSPQTLVLGCSARAGLVAVHRLPAC
jgi:hypothetical protein